MYLMNSNTTFVKVKFESRLMNYLAVSCYDSNTTFVKVKFDDLFYKLTLNVHSNTTFVKVKFARTGQQPYLGRFKYNIC